MVNFLINAKFSTSLFPSIRGGTILGIYPPMTLKYLNCLGVHTPCITRFGRVGGNSWNISPLTRNYLNCLGAHYVQGGGSSWNISPHAPEILYLFRGTYTIYDQVQGGGGSSWNISSHAPEILYLFRGAYTMYGQVQGSNQANLSTIQPHVSLLWFSEQCSPIFYFNSEHFIFEFIIKQ